MSFNLRPIPLSIASLLVLASVPAAAQSCTNASYFGTHYFLVEGFVQNQAGSIVPDKQLGKIVSDGNGNVTGMIMEASEGTVNKLPFTGTYSVNSDCSATRALSIVGPSGAPYVMGWNIQIAEGENQSFISVTSPGITLTGVEYSASNYCQTGALAGSYAFLGSGAPFGLGPPFTYNGSITLDGKGAFSGYNVYYNRSGASGRLNGTGVYSIGSDCSGTATLAGGISGNLALALLSDGTILAIQTDTGTIFSGILRPVSTSSILAQVAFGGGWYTALYFTNDTANTRSFKVNFVGDNGSPLQIPNGVGSSTTVTLGPSGTAIVEAPNVGSLSQGYATVSLPQGVTGYGVVRQSVEGIADQEAVVPLASGLASRVALVWDDTNYSTAVTMVNPGAAATVVTVTVSDVTGKTLATALVSLFPYGKKEGLLRSFLPDPTVMIGQRGFATFTVPSGNLAVLGLRFNGSAFTSIPTTSNQ